MDVLINNAGFGWYGFGSDMPWSLAWQMIQTNLTAAAHLTLMALHDMQARGTGHIINIGSVAGSLPEQGVAVYSATKAFIDNFTTALHRESCGMGVNVSVVRPGVVRTEFFELAANRSLGSASPASVSPSARERWTPRRRVAAASFPCRLCAAVVADGPLG